MKPTNYATNLPTRATLRATASRTRAAILDRVWGVPAVFAAVAIFAATATVAAGAAVVGLALAVAVATLSAHPVALLATAFVTTFALYTVPLLTFRAAARVAYATPTTA